MTATKTRRAGSPAKTKTTTARSAYTQGQELGIGGTLGVPIVASVLPGKGYSKRAMSPEAYPFSQLEPSKKLGNGDIIGPSFFIPEDSDPDRLLARARKRHPGWKFWSRKMTDTPVGAKEPVVGKRVWRATVEQETGVTAS